MGEETSQILSLWLLLLPILSTTHQLHHNLASVSFLRDWWPALVKLLRPPSPARFTLRNLGFLNCE